jgi:hypothetical protein
VEQKWNNISGTLRAAQPCQPIPKASKRQNRIGLKRRAIAACGGDARDAVKALIVANEFLEAQVEELRADVSKGYARGYHHGRFNTYTG